MSHWQKPVIAEKFFGMGGTVISMEAGVAGIKAVIDAKDALIIRVKK